MQIAQSLYEGIDLKKDGGLVGLITYMRTDSMRVSNDAHRRGARVHRRDATASEYLPEKPNVFKSQKNAQDAHEAIRPTSLELHAGEGAQAPERRAVQALQADLGSLRRVADDAGGLRPDRRRHRGEADSAAAARYAMLRPARERQGAQVRRLARAVRQGRREFDGEAEARAARRRGRRRRRSGGRERRGAERRRQRQGRARRSSTTTTRRSLPELAEGEALDARRRRPACSPSRSSRSRRRATTKARSCASSRSAASAAPAPTPRSSARCRRATTSRSCRAASSRRPSSARCVVDGLVSTELDFMDPSFTAKMEEELDEVEGGKLERVELLGALLQALPQAARRSRRSRSAGSPSPSRPSIKCEECGARCSSAGARTAGSWAARTTRSASSRATSGATARGRPQVKRDRLRLRQVRRSRW